MSTIQTTEPTEKIEENKSQTRYTIIAPNTIEKCATYKISATIHDPQNELNEPIAIWMCIKMIEFGREITINEITANVPANTTEMLAINLGELDVQNQHKLVVIGLSGVKFRHEANLLIQSRPFIILIQTDKAVYKPGDIVLFRVIVMDPFLKPVNNNSDKQLNIFIADSCQNRVKQWLNVKRINGVFSDKFQISDLPNLGSWQFTANFAGETMQKCIKIEKYVLPKFEVSIESPDYFVENDDKVEAIINAKYTYGKPMSGRAEVQISHRWHGILATKNIEIANGRGLVEFDMQTELLYGDDDSCVDSYEITATVTENFSNLSHNCSKTIEIHSKPYVLDVKSLGTQFRPGIPFEITISVRNRDGSSLKINEEINKIELIRKSCVRIHESGRDEENTMQTSFDYQLNESGDLHISLCLTKFDLWIEFKAIYMNEEYSLKRFYLWEETDRNREIDIIDAEILTTEPVINQSVTVKVLSSEILKLYTYVLLSRKKIVEAKTISIPKNETNFDSFTFATDARMTPELTIIIYIVRSDDICSKKLSIGFKENLKNFVDLNLSKLEAQPRDEIILKIETSPNSFVGLLGVDKSVLLPGDGNDLDEQKILNMMVNNFSKVQPNHQSHPDHLNFCTDFECINIILFTNVSVSKFLVCEIEESICFRSAIKKRKYAKWEVEESAVIIRTEFPETWIWDEMANENFSGSWTLKKKVPDTMTSWVITAFAIDPVNGFGICKTPATLTVFQPFFVSLNLPYSIKRGEVLTVPCAVFNYTERELQGEISLENEDNEFEFVDGAINDQIYPELAEQKMRTKKLYVAGNDVTCINFTIKATRIGQISIKVVVKTPDVSDGILQKLNVEAEGITQHFSRSVFIDLREKSEFEKASITIEIPKTIVPDSTRIEATCLGDILGGCVENLQNLIRKPYGCGEQNMLGFVPNIVVLNYLKNTNQLTPEIERKILQFMEIGYQRELNYKHSDGSFSVFGKSDNRGCTWLTAFVIKSLKQAAEHITIADSIIQKGLKFLCNAQKKDGSFVEKGRIFCKEMQGGSSGVALTAYVLTAFLECKESTVKYQSVIDNAIRNVIQLVRNSNDTYSLAIVTYALQLADHPVKTEVLQNLLNRAQVSGNQKWWGGQTDSSFTVEQTSYALLALLMAKGTEDPLPIVRYLLSERNEKGGFNGTQDTILGIEALARFAETIASSDTNLNLIIKSDADNTEKRFNVSTENALILQSEKLSPETRAVTLNATGRGCALFEIGYQYNVDEVTRKPDFHLKIETKQLSPDMLELNIQTSYKPPKDEENSNMTVLEASLPSGYVIDTNDLEALLELKNLIKRVETKNNDTVAIIYFDYLNKEPFQFNLNACCAHQVAGKRPASVIIYDYYDSDLSAQQFYSVA